LSTSIDSTQPVLVEWTQGSTTESDKNVYWLGWQTWNDITTDKGYTIFYKFAVMSIDTNGADECMKMQLQTKGNGTLMFYHHLEFKKSATSGKYYFRTKTRECSGWTTSTSSWSERDLGTPYYVKIRVKTYSGSQPIIYSRV
jgi:hypothetical protein